MNINRGITKRNVTLKAGRTGSRAGTNRRVRTRVKSRPRFIAFLVIMIGLFVGGFGFTAGLYDTTASVTTDFTSYTVAPGDTIWDIADEVSRGDTDTRIIVHEICQLNDVQAQDLQPGMVLSVPTNL